MSMVEELVSGILRSEDGFREALRHILEDELKISVPDFCERTGLSQGWPDPWCRFPAKCPPSPVWRLSSRRRPLLRRPCGIR